LIVSVFSLFFSFAYASPLVQPAATIKSPSIPPEKTLFLNLPLRTGGEGGA
jgi:hypothetical protein